MKPSTLEWIEKAEEDFWAAGDVARCRKRPVWSTVCFHAEQCAEKYLKARMEEAGLPILRTHDLEVLLNQLLSVEPLWGLSQTRPAKSDRLCGGFSLILDIPQRRIMPNRH
jgi:HEPN domain-containing protein